MLRRVTAPDGVQIAYEVSGHGPPLVLVHGAGSARWSFDLLRPLLEPRFTVAAVDRRGRGDSDDDRSGYRLESEFEDVAAVLRAVRDEAEATVHLFGHSYGGLVAAGAAPLAGRLGSLILYEPPMGAVLGAPAQLARWRELAEAGARDEFVSAFLEHVGGYTPDEIDALRETPAWEGRLAVVPTVPRELDAEQAHRLDGEALARISAPTLLLVGSRSPAWALRSTDAYAQALTGASVVRLEGQGHGALTTDPELVASEVESFLGAGDGTGRSAPDAPPRRRRDGGG